MHSTRSGAASVRASFLDSYRDLLRFLTRRTGSSDDARAIAHDTWIRLAESGQGAASPVPTEAAELRAYIFTVARHLAVDHLRHRGVVQRHADFASSDASQSPDESESLMYRQAMHAVEGALAGLPERARQVFLRNKVNGEDQGQLAQEFGVSRNMIERDMMLAMDRVEAAMARWHGASRAPQQRSVAGRRKSLAALLGLSAVGLGGAGLWRWVAQALPQWELSVATEHAQTRRVALPDGSILTLDALSRAEVSYYAGRRMVKLLAGAAFFEVTKDPSRPFSVDAVRQHDTVRTTVLGTRFGVERHVDDGVDIAVESGRVRVDVVDPRRIGSQELGAGQFLSVLAPAARRATGRVFDTLEVRGDAAGWRHGVVGFSDEPLGRAIDRLRRYLPRPVEVDARVAELYISGQVLITRSEDFLAALPNIVPVRSTLADGQWRIARRE